MHRESQACKVSKPQLTLCDMCDRHGIHFLFGVFQTASEEWICLIIILLFYKLTSGLKQSATLPCLRSCPLGGERKKAFNGGGSVLIGLDGI